VEQIEHRGWAGLFIAEGDDEIEVIDPALLEKLNNLTVFDEEISVFLQDGNESQRKLYEIGVRGGLPKIQFDSKSKSIYCSIPYISPRMLNDAEVRTLREYLMDSEATQLIHPLLAKAILFNLETPNSVIMHTADWPNPPFKGGALKRAP
jgi:hypothetical protein